MYYKSYVKKRSCGLKERSWLLRGPAIPGFLVSLCTPFIWTEAWVFISYKWWMIFGTLFKWDLHLFRLGNLFAIVHLDGQGQGRMADTSTDVYESDNIFKSPNVYVTVWISCSHWCFNCVVLVGHWQSRMPCWPHIKRDVREYAHFVTA